nr:GtrA family protein [Maliibacterium massiliense]
MKKLIELIKYGFWGAITTVINLTLFVLFKNWGMHYLLANTIAYFIAVVINYLCNRYLVFQRERTEDKRQVMGQFGKFVLMRLISWGVDTALFYVLVDLLHCNVYISRVGLSIGIILITYVINKLFIFKHNEGDKTCAGK